MANFKKFLWALAALPFITGCSSDSPNPNPDPDELVNGDGVYMTVNFSPTGKTGSRSFTNGENQSSGGVETGTDDENMINSVLLVLAGTDNSYIASSYIDNRLSANQTYTIYQATAVFSKSSISEYYAGLPSIQTNPQVNVIVYCNPARSLRNFIEGLNVGDTEVVDENTGKTIHWMDLTANLTSGTDNALWTDPVKNSDNTYTGGFVMTNTLTALRSFPAKFEDWSFYTSESNPFDLSGMNNEGTDYEVDNLNGVNGGAINVHRAAARFDFADGSQFDEDDLTDYDGYVYASNGISGEPFTYAVMTSTTGETTSTLVKATIVNMSLVNMLNSEYYLGRVSNTGLPTGNSFQILGPEKPWFTAQGSTTATGGNYVISPYAQEKADVIESDFSKYFFYPFFDNNGTVSMQGNGWGTAYVDDVVKEGNRMDGTKSYYVWRYVTENTMPRDNNKQANGQSTGIVFKVKLKAGDGLTGSSDKWDKQLADALDKTPTSNAPILYFFSGKLFCSWEHVQAAALAAAGYDESKGQDQTLDRSATLYRAVYGDGGVGEVKNDAGEVVYNDVETNDQGQTIPVKIDQTSPNYFWTLWHTTANPPVSGTAFNNFRAAVVRATFTIYQANSDTRTGWGYYCYYYYWNRHNDNRLNGHMAPMEFAVVRNNVYKIAVTRLMMPGHPRVPGNDPDTPTPDTPDEKSDLYLTVSVNVVPWVVRFNMVEF